MNTEPKAKPVALSTEQRKELVDIAATPGLVYQARSATIASLRRKGYVTTAPAGHATVTHTGFGARTTHAALVAVTITAEGAARLALKKSKG